MVTRGHLLLQAVVLLIAAWLDPGTAKAAQIRLTADLVRNFLDSRPELEKLGHEFAATYGDRGADDAQDTTQTLPAYMDVPAARSRVEAVLRRFSFNDLQQWGDVSDSVLTAAGYLDPAKPPPDVQGDKDKARGEIEADTSLSADAKGDALRQLDTQYAPLFDSVPLPENIPVVRGFVDRIRLLTGED